MRKRRGLKEFKQKSIKKDFMSTQDAVHIEATDACNLFCSGCGSPHGKNFMSVEKFTTVAEKLVGHTTKIGMTWRGESCLHPNLPELAEVARQLGFKTRLATNTAVPNLSKKDYVQKLFDNLNWVEICVDGYDDVTTRKYRVGANWKTIKRNLQTISKIKADCLKTMRVLMFKYNDGKESVYREMAKKYGMNEIIFAAPLVNLEPTISDELADIWLSTNEKYQRYNRIEGKWFRSTGKCNAVPIVSVHGTVYPCCADWKLEHQIGNLINENWVAAIEEYKKMVPTLGTQKMCELCCLSAKKVNFREKII